MTQWSNQRNVYTLIPQNNSMNKETTHILTTLNTNTPRISPTINHHVSQQVSSSSSSAVYDDSLTNLSWLHDINILKRTMPPMNSSTSTNNKRKEPSSPSNSNIYHPNDILDNNNELTINNVDDNDEQWRMYKTNPNAKPVYSYSQLILLAMKQSGYEKMTLQMIYEWVAEHFPYFKKMEPTWQNSIRHNLSLNKCFVKVPRTKKDSGTGKGGFWKLSPEYLKQRSQQQQEINSPPAKRSRYSKRSISSSLNDIISINTTPLIKNCSSISYENIKNECWIDPILPNDSSSSTMVDRSYIQMPSSFLSPTSSPDCLNVSSFNSHQINDFSSILTPSPSSSPSSVISKHNFNSTKLDDADMLLLDPSTFDLDLYFCETTNDIDVQPLLSSKIEHDLFHEFNAALTDLTSSTEAIAAITNDSNTFDAFDYSSKHSTFNCLFDDDEQPQPQQQQNLSIEYSNNLGDLTVKGCGIKRPSWWITNDLSTLNKLPSLETAFDLKLSK